MILVITSIKLKQPLKFFALSAKALKITKQLKESEAVGMKNTGFWLNHYTQSLWNSKEEIQAFYTSGAHAEAMKHSASIAQEIRTITIPSDQFIPWNAAKEHLKMAKPLNFKHQ